MTDRLRLFWILMNCSDKNKIAPDKFLVRGTGLEEEIYNYSQKTALTNS